MLKKNEIKLLEITALSSDGNGIAKIEDFVVFVPYTVVGDIVKVLIVKVNKSFAFGKVLEIATPSENRIVPTCEVFEKCGGCSFLNMTYQEELRQKQGFVTYCLERIGGIKHEVSEIIASPSTQEYRNKVQFPFKQQDESVMFGFYAPRSHRIVPIKNGCLLQPSVMNEIAKFCAEFFNVNDIYCYDETTKKGDVRHLLIRKSDQDGSLMVCFVINRNGLLCEKFLCEQLVATFPDIKTIVINVNRNDTNVILGEKCRTIYGDGYLNDMLSGVPTRISPLSFFQINNASANLLYNQIKQAAGLDGSQTVLDLYCGAGTIGLSIANSAKKLYGAEVVPQAVEDAKFNAKNMGVHNAEFFLGDSGEIAKKLQNDNIKLDVIITDPPRKGCDEQTLETIVSLCPKKVIMVSCNAATLARDVKYLVSKGYVAEKIQPVDLFPRTTHVECLISLNRED